MYHNLFDVNNAHYKMIIESNNYDSFAIKAQRNKRKRKHR